jgi:predicted TIM-barrel fold metal-dependent hydrolase
MPAVVGWLGGDGSRRWIAYRGALDGPDLRVHYAFDGWRGEPREIRLERVDERLAVGELSDLDGHLAVDCAITNGGEWDNNREVDYRLWIGFEAIDAHLHVSGAGSGALGIHSLGAAMASAGITAGVSSWMDNRALDRLDLEAARLAPLVWVRPGETPANEVRRRLTQGAVGIKLHPTIDDYRPDDRELDRYLEIAAEVGCPVACHSAPGDADPDHIRRLAERFREVPVILYHTYLGPNDGRARALRHAREQANLYLETSWCRWEIVERLIRELGPQRVLFGSDASIDGHEHYCRHPPNVEGSETYNDGLLRLVRRLDRESARQVMGDNARRLFRLNGFAGKSGWREPSFGSGFVQ